MALYAAHLTRTRGAAPSAFTVAAQEALAGAVKPALRRLVQFLCDGPDRWRWPERWFDELYLLLDAALQYHYLKHYAASFSESFYGLMRVSAAGGNSTAAGGAWREWGAARLPRAVERASLALLVLPPYLQDRIEQRMRMWQEEYEQGLTKKDTWSAVRAALMRLYRALQCVLLACRVLQLCAYCASQSGSATPALRLLRLALSEAPPPPAPEQDGGIAVVSLALRAAEYLSFGVQLLRWWDARAPAARTLPPPDPPQRDSRASSYRNVCPLCHQPWRVPAVLPVSGYVFCYSCISRSLRVTPRCPVTHCAATEAQLIRLYHA